MTGITASAIGVIISLALMVFLVLKGLNLIPSALIAGFVLSFFVEGGLATGLFTTFAQGFGNLAAGYIVTFMIAGVFSGLMSVSGSDVVFGKAVISKFGKDSAIYGLGIFIGVLAACGVMSFPFLAAIMAFTLLRAANLPRTIGVLVLATCGSAFMFVMPGAPSVINVIMSTFIPDTNLFAGGWIGYLMLALQLVWGFGFIRLIVIPKCRREGVGYTDTPTEIALKGQFPEIPEENLPSFFVSLIPLATVLIGVIIFQFALQWDSYMSCFVALLIGCLLIIAMNWQQVKGKIFSAMSNGCMTSCTPMIMICVVAGYGAVVTSTSAYDALLGAVTNMNINPYILVAVGTALLAGICGDSGSGLIISAQTICQKAIEMGANPGMVKRLTMTACTTLDSLPHSSNIAAYISFMGCTHKEVYGQVAVIQLLGTSVVTCVGTILMMIFY